MQHFQASGVRPKQPAGPQPSKVKLEQPVALDTSRPSAMEIFDRAAEMAKFELVRPARALLFSGLAGGMTMGLTGLAVSMVRAALAGHLPWSAVPGQRLPNLIQSD